MIQFGLMNRGQFPVGGDAAQHWQEMLEQVRWAEKLGFNSIMNVYKRELDACGKPFPTEFPMMREVVVASSREKAMRMAQPYLEAKYSAYHEWGQDKVMPAGDNNFAIDFEDLVQDRFLFGSPEEIAEQILNLIRRFGVNHFVMGVQFPGMPQQMVLEEMQMRSEEVFAKVRAGV